MISPLEINTFGMEFSRSTGVSVLTAILEWAFFLWYMHCRTGISIIGDIFPEKLPRMLFLLFTALHMALQFSHQPIAMHCILLIVLWSGTISLLFSYGWYNAVFESSKLCLILELGKSIYRSAVIPWLLQLTLTRLFPGNSGRITPVAAFFLYLIYLGVWAFVLRGRRSSLRNLRMTPVQTASLLFPLLLYLYVRQFQTSLFSLETPPDFSLWLSFDFLHLAVAVCALIVISVTTGLLSVQMERNILLHRQLLEDKHSRQYLVQKETMEQINRRYHDLKYCLSAMEEALPEGESPSAGNQEQLRRFIASMRSQIEPYETIQETGNRTMNILLAERIQECQEKQIRFIPYIDGRAVSFLPSMDLCVLFGNAMDNAIEASMRLEDPRQREITVKIARSDSMALFRFVNFCDASSLSPGGEGRLFHTTKSDASSHGYGLESIRSIAFKYGGTMTANLRENQFELIVLFPSPDPSPSATE